MFRQKKRSTETLYEIIRQLATASSFAEAIKLFKDKVGAVLGGEVEIIIRKDEKHLEDSLLKHEKEKAIAAWVFANKKEAGFSTSTLPDAKKFYLPLMGFGSIVGVLSFHSSSKKTLSESERAFLATLATQLGHYIERSLLEAEERRATNLTEIEKVHERVLNALAEQLLAPLQKIAKTLPLLKKETNLSSEAVAELNTIEASMKHLFHLRQSAAALADLSTGLTAFQKADTEIGQLIDSSLEKIRPQLGKHKLQVKMQEKLPKIPLDASLMDILLYHLILNAIQYSPEGTLIEIEAELLENCFVLSVLDHGAGIPPKCIPLIFKKFYRIPGTHSTGLGLGLPLASLIAKMHEGELKVQNVKEAGAKFFVIIPLA